MNKKRSYESFATEVTNGVAYALPAAYRRAYQEVVQEPLRGKSGMCYSRRVNLAKSPAPRTATVAQLHTALGSGI